MEVKEIATEDDEYRQSYKIEIDGKRVFHVWDGMEPEDATLVRDLSDCYSIFDLLKQMYEAGKRGEEVNFTQQ